MDDEWIVGALLLLLLLLQHVQKSFLQLSHLSILPHSSAVSSSSSSLRRLLFLSNLSFQ